MKLWQYLRQNIRRVKANKVTKWTMHNKTLRRVYYELWAHTYYDIAKRDHAIRREKFFNQGG